MRQRLKALNTAGAACLAQIGRGIERETLRVTEAGSLSLRAHPQALGSALTHPQITTDFCEAQPELVTGVHRSISGLLQELHDIHAFVWQQLRDELLWPLSLPCRLPAASDIPLASYGDSHSGRFKRLYRMGLKHRYGSAMQTICGMHYNFSLPEEFWGHWVGDVRADEATLAGARDDALLGLVRRFLQDEWVLLYLLGASPVFGDELADAAAYGLQPWPGGGFYHPGATSLRNSRLGYNASVQEGLQMRYDSLSAYCDSMQAAISEPYAPWVELAAAGGEPVQLGTGRLQIENELYDAIRLKRIAPGLRPLTALRRHGVQYLEVRCVDINPLLPLGCDEYGCRLLDLFLLRCLLLPSAGSGDRQDAAHNLQLMARDGRNADMRVRQSGRDVPLGEALGAVVGDLAAIADWLAEALDDGEAWRDTAARAKRHLENPPETPSGEQLRQLEEGALGLYDYGLRLAEGHRHYWSEHRLSGANLDRMRERSAESLARQRQIEGAESGSFEAWLRQRLSW